MSRPEPGTTWKRGLCGVCPAGCWIEAETDADGRLTAIRPDTSHPLGMLCARGEKAPAIVHSEHRLRHPMRRRGPKGTYEFDPISWDEAYDEIAERLTRIRSESGPEAVAIYTGRGSFELSLCDVFQPKGVAVSSASSVLFPFGSPNTMGVGALCYVSFAMIAPHVTMGRMLVNMFTDIEHSDLLLVWGTNPATDSPPLDMQRLEAAARRGARIVVIDPRRTETVRRTGAEWVPIRPGTDGALALGMINVIVDEELYDEEFATKWCHGFDELAGYVQHFRPEVVESITGIPAPTVVELARAVANAHGACPVTYTGLEYSNSGVQAIRAVLTFFALAGQLDVPGGIGLAMPGTHFPINRSGNVANPDASRAVARDRFPLYTHYRGEGHATGLIDAVLRGDPYPIRGLIIHGGSILTSWPQPSVWRKVLAKLDLLVTIDRQLTGDSAWADIVLPASTMFEIESYMTYGPLFRLRERLVDPVGEARNDYLIMAQLAARLGYGDLYPQSEEELLEHALEGSGWTLADVRAAGGEVRIDAPLMEFRKWEKGRLRPDGQPGFDTPTGKFEIHSTLLEEFGYEPLPKYTEPREGPLERRDLAGEFPLVFNSGSRTQSDFRSQHHGVEPLARDLPEPFVEINVRDAETRGIADGDLVEVRTPRGAVPFRARVTRDIVQGSVDCSMGGGGAVGSRAWREWNVNELTDLGNHDEISGFPVYKSLLCEVTKLEAEARTGVPRSEAAAAVSAAGERPIRIVYLDNNATTRVSREVREVMLPWLDGCFGNPSSIHRAGRDAEEAVERARREVAQLIGAKPRRIVFTGGGSEADNMALKGVAFAGGRRGGHVIVSSIEHPAVLGAAAFLERIGYRVTRLPVDGRGIVTPEALEEAIDDETVVVSVMMANNETGVVQPVAELAEVAHRHGAYFHTDAVQAAGKIAIDVETMGIDLLTLSAHKIHGPKGVGALYVRRGVELEPLVHGGSQEEKRRAGTENVAGIAGFGRAAEEARRGLEAMRGVGELRDRLESRIRALVPSAVVNGGEAERLPNTVNLTLPSLRGESLVIALDQHGVALSSGSACRSGSPEPTHVLLAMGRSAEEAHCSVRLSLSRETTEEEIDSALAAFESVLEEMRETVRFLPCK
jgi:cysteine desulfurase NifS